MGFEISEAGAREALDFMSREIASAIISASGIYFWGSSAVIGPQGEMLARASSDNDEVVLASLDLDRSEQLRQIWPFLRDRRIDAYQDLQRRFRD